MCLPSVMPTRITFQFRKKTVGRVRVACGGAKGEQADGMTVDPESPLRSLPERVEPVLRGVEQSVPKIDSVDLGNLAGPLVSTGLPDHWIASVKESQVGLVVLAAHERHYPAMICD